jgi:hypothetical protein
MCTNGSPWSTSYVLHTASHSSPTRIISHGTVLAPIPQVHSLGVLLGYTILEAKVDQKSPQKITPKNLVLLQVRAAFALPFAGGGDHISRALFGAKVVEDCKCKGIRKAIEKQVCDCYKPAPHVPCDTCASTTVRHYYFIPSPLDR